MFHCFHIVLASLLRLIDVQVSEAMVSARLVLLLAALMLLATPLVNSVPSDYVAPEEADIAATGGEPGWMITTAV
jgi:hypothetical protein